MLNRIILFNLISIFSLLGQTGNLAGNITDSQTSQPLTGTNISIESTVLGAATDMDGQFVILDVPVGSYNISVEYVGYRKVLKNNVVIRSGKTTILNVEMIEDVLEATGIEVTANYFKIPKESVVSSESMDFEEIRRAPGSNMDIQRVVQALSVTLSARQKPEICGMIPGMQVISTIVMF
ncbi:MAG: carboxypeptidase-like regulatory domain-containing protein [Calditrichia bacterium]|nr:carboxypeptidase-like regulatory domain-containing protein [Calditrichia bacterium]